MTLNLKNKVDRESWKAIKNEINKLLKELNFKAQFDNFYGFCWGDDYDDPVYANKIQIPNEYGPGREEVEIELVKWNSKFYEYVFKETIDDNDGYWCWVPTSQELEIEKLFDLAYLAPENHCFLSISWRDKHCCTDNSLVFYKNKINWSCTYLDCVRSKSGEWIDNLVKIFDGTLIDRFE